MVRRLESFGLIGGPLRLGSGNTAFVEAFVVNIQEDAWYCWDRLPSLCLQRRTAFFGSGDVFVLGVTHLSNKSAEVVRSVVQRATPDLVT